MSDNQFEPFGDMVNRLNANRVAARTPAQPQPQPKTDHATAYLRQINQARDQQIAQLGQTEQGRKVLAGHGIVPLAQDETESASRNSTDKNAIDASPIIMSQNPDPSTLPSFGDMRGKDKGSDVISAAKRFVDFLKEGGATMAALHLWKTSHLLLQGSQDEWARLANTLLVEWMKATDRPASAAALEHYARKPLSQPLFVRPEELRKKKRNRFPTSQTSKSNGQCSHETGHPQKHHQNCAGGHRGCGHIGRFADTFVPSHVHRFRAARPARMESSSRLHRKPTNAQYLGRADLFPDKPK